VTLLCGNFLEYREEIQSASHIWYNNHGGWFDGSKHKDGFSTNDAVCALMIGKAAGQRVLTCNPLAALKWTCNVTYPSDKHSTADYTQDPIGMHLHTVTPLKKWVCANKNCANRENDPLVETCTCGARPKTIRASKDNSK
jgi:hypothetical protein